MTRQQTKRWTTLTTERGRLIIWIIPPVLAAVLYSTYVISSNFRSPENFSLPFLLQSVLFFYIYLYLIYRIDRMVERRMQAMSTFFKQSIVVLLSFGLSELVTIAIYAAMKQYYISVLGQNDVLSIYHLSSRALNTFFGFVLMYSIYFAFKVYNASLEHQLVAEKARGAHAALRFDQLSSTLDPHFLFNNLNTLHSLLPDNAVEAERFVLSLSKTLRYSLQSRHEALVSLDEELDMLREYASIMTSRLGDALQLNLVVPARTDWMVYPMTFIHLLENAIKHNEASSRRPLRVRIDQEGDFVVCRNNRNPKLPSTSTGGSLAALAEMYGLRAPAEIRIDDGEHEFAVYVPIIRRNQP